MTPRVSELAGAAGHDASLVAQITDRVDAAYAAGEAGLWRRGWRRTTPREIADLIATGGMLVSSARVVPAARLLRRAPFEEVSKQASDLATPCESLVFRKPLAG